MVITEDPRTDRMGAAHHECRYGASTCLFGSGRDVVVNLAKNESVFVLDPQILGAAIGVQWHEWI